MANPLVKIARGAAADMLRFAAEFGLTPVARSRLSVAGRLSGPGKFDGLLA
jgi:phage terminase small subunit